MKGLKNAVIRALAFSLLAAMLMTAVTSCAQKENTDDEDVSGYEKNGLGGYSLNILGQGDKPTVYATSNMVYTEEANGDTMREAIYSRNSKLCDKYNFTIDQSYTEDMLAEVIKFTAAQDDAYQVIIGGSPANYMDQNLITNIYDVPYLKLDESYWYGDIIDMYSINGFASALGGYMIYDAFDNMIITMYNRPLADDYGMENLYTVTSEGGFTMERMSTEIQKVITDLDNNGQYSWNDRIGLLYASNSCGAYLSAGGIQFVKKDAQGEFYFDESVVEKAETLGMNMKEILCGKGSALDWLSAVDGASTIIGMIENKQVLFQNMLISQVRRFYREIKTDFGLLPMPKMDEEQSGYCSNACNPNIMIPISNMSVDKTGFCLEALCRESADFENLYFHICLESKYSRDAESIDMVMLARENLIADPMGYYGFGNLNSVLNAAIGMGRHIANLVPNFIDDVNADIDEINMYKAE